MVCVNSLLKSVCYVCLLAGCAEQYHQSSEAIALPVFNNAEEAQAFDRLCQPVVNTENRPLLQRLSRQNLQIEAAWVRVRQSQAQAKKAGARRWPTVNLTAEASRGDMLSGAQPGEGAPANGTTDVSAAGPQTRFQASLAAQYELDLWNRLGHLSDAAEWRVRAQDSDARAMAVSLSAQLLESWFGLGLYARQQQFLLHQLDVSQQLLALLKLRYEKGQTSVLDAPLQRSPARMRAAWWK